MIASICRSSGLAPSTTSGMVASRLTLMVPVIKHPPVSEGSRSDVPRDGRFAPTRSERLDNGPAVDPRPLTGPRLVQIRRSLYQWRQSCRGCLPPPADAPVFHKSLYRVGRALPCCTSAAAHLSNASVLVSKWIRSYSMLQPAWRRTRFPAGGHTQQDRADHLHAGRATAARGSGELLPRSKARLICHSAPGSGSTK
jgi:hypothetical protein